MGIAVGRLQRKSKAPRPIDEAFLNHEVDKRALLEQLAGIVRAKWKGGVWNKGFRFDTLHLDHTFDSNIIEQEKEFFERNLVQFIWEIIGVRVFVRFLKKRLPSGGCYVCKFEIRRCVNKK